MSRILVHGINFKPEVTGIAPYTSSLSEALSRDGWQVEVITGFPHYPSWRVSSDYRGMSRIEDHGPMTVRRTRQYTPRYPGNARRILMELSAGVLAVFQRLRMRESVDVALFVTPALFSSVLLFVWHRIFARGTPTVVWVQDLYGVGLAETANASSVSSRAVGAVEGWLFRHADRVVVVHSRFVPHLLGLGVRQNAIEVIENWKHVDSTGGGDYTLRTALGLPDTSSLIAHFGNMGVKQGLETVVAAARLCSSDDELRDLHFVLVGNGSRRNELYTHSLDIDNLHVVDPLPEDLFVAAMRSANLLLLNEKPGVREMCVPSKLTSYFSTGVPVIAATEADSISASELRQANAGITVPPGEPFKLITAIRSLLRDETLCRELGRNGVMYSSQAHSSSNAQKRFIQTLESIVKASSVHS